MKSLVLANFRLDFAASEEEKIHHKVVTKPWTLYLDGSLNSKMELEYY